MRRSDLFKLLFGSEDGIDIYDIEDNDIDVIDVINAKTTTTNVKDYHDDYNPYTDGPWGTSEWHCIRCGGKLNPIAKDDENWDYCWQTMLEDETQWFLCGNENCCHYNAPLILHHPIKGYQAPAGDSYSISWVK